MTYTPFDLEKAFAGEEAEIPREYVVAYTALTQIRKGDF